MAEFEPVLLRRIAKKADPLLDAYRADGGYRALQKAVHEMTPVQVMDVVKASEPARPRRCGFSTRLEVDLSTQGPPRAHLYVHQRRRSEPCTFNNRILMEEDPHQVLEGIMLSCYATRSSSAYLYLRYEYGRSYPRLATGHRRIV